MPAGAGRPCLEDLANSWQGPRRCSVRGRVLLSASCIEKLRCKQMISASELEKSAWKLIAVAPTRCLLCSRVPDSHVCRISHASPEGPAPEVAGNFRSQRSDAKHNMEQRPPRHGWTTQRLLTSVRPLGRRDNASQRPHQDSSITQTVQAKSSAQASKSGSQQEHRYRQAEESSSSELESSEEDMMKRLQAARKDPAELRRVEPWLRRMLARRHVPLTIAAFNIIVVLCAEAGDATSTEFWVRAAVEEAGVKLRPRVCKAAVECFVAELPSIQVRDSTTQGAAGAHDGLLQLIHHLQASSDKPEQSPVEEEEDGDAEEEEQESQKHHEEYVEYADVYEVPSSGGSQDEEIYDAGAAEEIISVVDELSSEDREDSIDEHKSFSVKRWRPQEQRQYAARSISELSDTGDSDTDGVVDHNASGALEDLTKVHTAFDNLSVASSSQNVHARPQDTHMRGQRGDAGPGRSRFGEGRGTHRVFRSGHDVVSGDVRSADETRDPRPGLSSRMRAPEVWHTYSAPTDASRLDAALRSFATNPGIGSAAGSRQIQRGRGSEAWTPSPVSGAWRARRQATRARVARPRPVYQ